MGALASCEHCGCLGGNDGLTKPNTENDTDESSSEEEITTDEETELINKTKNKTKNKERDESYILYSDDEIDNKTKKSKKKKEEEVIAQVQQSIMQISKNEVDKHSGMYGMDVKTMELLMNVNLNNQPPQPSMASIASQELTSMPSIDYKQASPIIDNTIDMREQLKSYTSNDMISISEMNSNHNELEKEDSYNTLLLDDTDNTPALPLNQQQNNISERDRLQKSLGGLDYDFDNENPNLEPLNTLRSDEKNINDLRIKNIVLKANNSRGPDEIEELIKQQYTHKLHESHEEVTDDESSYEEHEKQEIERMKTEEMVKKSSRRQVSKAKLFRPNTVSEWHEDDMDDMHLAMTKEMEAMVERQKSKESNKTPTINNNNNMDDIFDSDYDSEEEYDTINDNDIDKQIRIKSPVQNNMNAGTKTSALFRVKSTYKWDLERVEQENKDMQAQLANLMVAHQNSVETDPGKQAKSLPFINGQ